MLWRTRRSINVILVCLGLFWVKPAVAKSIKIAGLFSSPNANQYKCIVGGSLRNAQQNGLKIIYNDFDFQNNLVQAASAAKKIIERGYDVVVGPRTSKAALATAPLFEAANIPQILPVASHPAVTKGRQYVVRMVSSGHIYSRLMARFIAEKLRARKILVAFNLSDPYSVFYKENLEKNLQRLASLSGVALHGSQVAKVVYLPLIDGSKNFLKLIEKVKLEKFDVVYAPNSGVQTVSIYSVLARHKIATSLVTHAGLFGAVDLIGKNFSATTPIYFNGIWDQNLRGDNAKRFLADIARHCMTKIPNVRLATGFDTVQQLLTTLKLQPEMRGKSLVSAFKKSPYAGLLGAWRADASGDPLRSLNVYAYRQGGFKLYATVAPELIGE